MVGSQLVGLVPLKALLDAAAFYCEKESLFILEEEQRIRLVGRAAEEGSDGRAGRVGRRGRSSQPWGAASLPLLPLHFIDLCSEDEISLFILDTLLRFFCDL